MPSFMNSDGWMPKELIPNQLRAPPRTTDTGNQHDDEQRKTKDQPDFGVFPQQPVIQIHHENHRDQSEHGK
ncbi:hypothetical protein HMSSN139_38510 [Paenibacillus sp. HMSSN-139]|nr:hypothetical protein HMSSN139_38510 [Paenibacillus sp. HMSSN-139]